MLLCLPVSNVLAERVHKIRRSIQINQKQMGEVQQEIERSQAQIEEMRKKERLILDLLDQMELELQISSEKLDRLNRERTSLGLEIQERRERHKELTHEIEALQSLLGDRLAALYKFGRHAYLNLLVSAQDISGLQHRWVYLRAVAEQDSELIGQFLDKKIEDEKLIQELASREERLRELVKEIGQQKAEIEKVKRQQVALLQDIHNQEAMYQRYVAELAAVSRELEKKIDGLQRQLEGDKPEVPQPDGGFANKKGALPYPVSGKVVSTFGTKRHKKFGTKIRSNGIEFATEHLSPVVAIYSGQVLYSAKVKGYGKVIIIDHGDKYYTLTANLAEVTKEAGSQAEAGELIGYAGYSPMPGEEGKVYFEVRHLGKALDPQDWLLPALASLSGGTIH
jgi:septal ring factor EnvC (AmiA/AmiB activator)